MKEDAFSRIILHACRVLKRVGTLITPSKFLKLPFNLDNIVPCAVSRDTGSLLNCDRLIRFAVHDE